MADAGAECPGMRRLARDPVQGDVVRARLDALVAELNRGPGEEDPRTPIADDPPDVVDEGRAPALDEPVDVEAHVDAPPRDGRSLRPPASAVPSAPGSVARRVWEFGRAHAAVVGVIGLVAVLAATWTLMRSRTVAIADVAPSAVPAVHTPSVTPSPTPVSIRAHVLGAIASPGVVTLAEGDRVEDAIAAAGGFTSGARPGDLNLAAPVSDGDQIAVGNERDPGGEIRPAGAGVPGGGASGGVGGAASATLDLNKATIEQLIALPGVGPVTAQAIVKWRSDHQKFSRVEELQEVDGIGPKTFAQLQPLVRV